MLQWDGVKGCVEFISSDFVGIWLFKDNLRFEGIIHGCEFEFW